MKKEDISNTYIHLTNVAIQKHAPNVDRGKGMKWPIRSLRMYLNTRHGEALSLELHTNSSTLQKLATCTSSIAVCFAHMCWATPDACLHVVGFSCSRLLWRVGCNTMRWVGQHMVTTLGIKALMTASDRIRLFSSCCCGRRYCCCLLGPEATNELFNSIQNVILRALLAVQPSMINDKHCFEVNCCCCCRHRLSAMHLCLTKGLHRQGLFPPVVLPGYYMFVLVPQVYMHVCACALRIMDYDEGLLAGCACACAAVRL
jgi:hypothetical protein